MNGPVTTFGPGPLKPTKPFAWSYSRLKNWRVCGRKHANIDLLKRFPMDETAAMREGQETHNSIAAYLKNGTPLPATMRDYYADIRKVIGNDPQGITYLIEAEMAFRHDLQKCGYFEPGVWCRVKVDFAKIGRRGAVAVDWKTGQIKPDEEQLAITAQAVFSTYPWIDKVRTQYVWLGQNAKTTQDFGREDMPSLWQKLGPEIDTYQRAYELGDFPPNPSGICIRHCNISSCEYYQKGSRG